MPFKNRLLLAGLLSLLAAVLTICFAPFTVSNGVRAWIWWKARQQKLSVKIDKIDAPFLRPVVLRGFHLASRPEAAFRIDLGAAQATIHLNLKAILLRTRGRMIRTLSVEGLGIDVRRENTSGTALSQSVWLTGKKLLPDNFNLNAANLRVENGSTVILCRNVSVSASEIEAGRFNAGEITVASPWFRQTFSQIRGATNWQSNRLTLAGITLTRGLDVQSITADLSRLGKERIGFECDIDAYGGQLRTSISNEWRSRHSNWTAAGSAKYISLGQTAEAIGYADRVGGLLHACKFTFRGDTHELARTTASVWIELTSPAWRDREADLIMLGAALYNRQIQVQQLYVKQGKNQLTLSGETSFPTNSSDWLGPDFRGDISASINNLGDFVALFGANRADFSGEITIDGTMDARDRKIGGRLTIGGASLKVFKTSIDALRANLNLRATELEIEKLELNRKSDFLRGQGKIDMSHEHRYSGSLSAAINSLADYLPITGETLAMVPKATAAKTQITINSGVWDAHATITIPGSSPLNLTANFPLQIGKGWDVFLTTPLNLTLDFPTIFLANAPQYFDPEIFEGGILSGKMSVSGTLQHPRIDGEVQLVDGKLKNAPMNVTAANSHITFRGESAAIDFFNAATPDIDLSGRGEIDLHDVNDLRIKISGTMPIFDLTRQDIDCVGQIGFAPVGLSLAPAIDEIEFHGGLFRGDWTVSLKGPGSNQSPGALHLAERKFRLCFGKGAEGKLLTLGVHPPPQPERVRPRKPR
jgi:hypothetical protein